MLAKIKQEFEILPIRTRITLVTSTIIIMAILSSSSLLIKNVYEALEEEQGNRVLAIGRTLAQLETIKREIGQEDGWKLIQPIAERIRIATNVDYIVIFDMNRIRYSHPIESRIGTLFQGGDEGPALGQHEYTSLAKGVNGTAIRAFVPILDQDGFQQVGVVVVGTMLPSLKQLIYNHRIDISISITLGMFIGLIGAWILTNSIKKQMFQLEPIEIARLLEEREALINSIEEGIIAIDRNEKVRVLNHHAARILGVDEDMVGCSIEELIPHSQLPFILEQGTSQTQQMMELNDTIIMTNRLPIIVKGKTIGAVATFQDRTEVLQLAEELTGIRKFSDELRAQNHEYMNNLHTLAGLIQLKRYDDALEQIFSYTEEQEGFMRFLMNNIKNYHISGLILGKKSHAKELGIELIVDEKSMLPELPQHIRIPDLNVIIGNLLENAIDALTNQDNQEKQIKLKIYNDSSSLYIEVKDNGIGIPKNKLKEIFTLGFTTKGSKNRGVGLALINQYTKSYNGTVNVDSQTGVGTVFVVSLPI